MNVQMFLIRNRNSDKNVAVMIHDPESGRVLFKARPSDSSLMQTLNVWRDKQIIVQMTERLPTLNFVRRYRVLPTDADYGRHLIDKFIYRPYEVRFSKVIETSSPDSALDEAYKSVDAAPPKTTLFQPIIRW